MSGSLHPRRLEEGPTPVFTRETSRAVDRTAVDEYAIPSILLMENASRNVAIVAEGLATGPVLVVCGPGNNGGDGFAAARHLHNAGHDVMIACACDPDRAQGDAETNLKVVLSMEVPFEHVADGRTLSNLITQQRPSLIIDALLGTGVNRPVEGLMLEYMHAINDAPGRKTFRVLAVDTPSGLDVDNGGPLGEAVRADATVTFLGIKQGFLSIESQPYLGEVFVADIGAPRELVERLGRADKRIERFIATRVAEQTVPEPSGALGRNRS